MIYVLTKQFLHTADGSEGGLDVAVFPTFAAAKRRAARDGDHLVWEAHDSHGRCWTAEAGRYGLVISLVIHECEDERSGQDAMAMGALLLSAPVVRCVMDQCLGTEADQRKAAEAYAAILKALARGRR